MDELGTAAELFVELPNFLPALLTLPPAVQEQVVLLPLVAHVSRPDPNPYPKPTCSFLIEAKRN